MTWRLLGSDQAAIGPDVLARDPAGLVAGQPRHHAGDVLGPPGVGRVPRGRVIVTHGEGPRDGPLPRYGWSGVGDIPAVGQPPGTSRAVGLRSEFPGEGGAVAGPSCSPRDRFRGVEAGRSGRVRLIPRRIVEMIGLARWRFDAGLGPS